jgi:hypothetical protein
VGKNKKLRKQLASIESRIGDHRAKIADEKRKHRPDPGLIGHWQREISNWLLQIDEIERRLKRD